MPQIFRSDSQRQPDATHSIDVSGMFVIPGLIDSHVHLATNPNDSTYRALVEAKLEHALLSGITSVRDMAGDGRVLSQLAQEAGSGELISPEIYFSALFAGPRFFADPRAAMSTQGKVPGEVPWMQAVRPETDLAIEISRAKDLGATGIKVYDDLTADQILRITKEAHRQSMQVWSHIKLQRAMPLDVLRAGVDGVSHLHFYEAVTAAPFLGEMIPLFDYNDSPFGDIIELLKKHETVWDPTFYFNTSKFHQPDSVTQRAVVKFGCDFAKKLVAETGFIATGTDTFLDPLVHVEMENLVTECSFSPHEALTAATLGGARAIGIESTHGSLETGKVADLVVLAKDPLQDIRNTTEVEYVFKRGKMYDPRSHHLTH